MNRYNGVFTTIQINQQKTPRLFDLILIRKLITIIWFFKEWFDSAQQRKVYYLTNFILFVHPAGLEPATC